MSILKNESRIGNFTSSEIYRLMGKDPAGYINEKNMERLLGISLSTDVDARPLQWGKLLEDRIFNLLPTDYTISSQETDTHPLIDYWAGSKDGTREATNRAVADFKCPFARKSFCQLVLPLYLGYTGIEAMRCLMDGFEHEGRKYPAHADGKKYFYQLVSNACIGNMNYAELIVYMPYQSELLEIGNLAGDDPSLKWIQYTDVPYLPTDGYFKNINTISFEVPRADKDLLTEAVLKSGKLLIDRPQKLQQAA